MEGQVNAGSGCSSVKSVEAWCVHECHGFLVHPFGDDRPISPVPSDGVFLDCRSVSIPPAVVGVEVAGDIAVACWVEVLFAFGDVK